MEFKIVDGVATLYLEGRIDSSNADEVQNEIFNHLEAEHTSVIVDCKKLQYISSAGLRIVLKIKKENPELQLINVSSEVYDIFEMTGFTEMIEVKKAFRNISVEGCDIIGKGANGCVYRLDPDTIVKVYMNPDSLDDIKRERELARTAFVSGIPTAIPYDVVIVDDKYYGSVFELLNSTSLAKKFIEDRENIDKYIRDYALTLKKMHSTMVKEDSMPSMKKEVLSWFDMIKGHVDDGHYYKLLSLVNMIPDSNNLLHCDYHAKNVMFQNDELLLIDMDTLAHGNPVFEFGAMYSAYIGFYEVNNEEKGAFLGMSAEDDEKLWNDTLKIYFDNDEAKIEDCIKKAKVFSYFRILRRTIRKGVGGEEGKRQTEKARELFYAALDEVESLAL